VIVRQSNPEFKLDLVDLDCFVKKHGSIIERIMKETMKHTCLKELSLQWTSWLGNPTLRERNESFARTVVRT
jgi:hypothetical protein